MKIKSLREYQTGKIRHQQGDVYEENDIHAKSLIQRGLAVEFVEPEQMPEPEQKEEPKTRGRKKKVDPGVESEETK